MNGFDISKQKAVNYRIGESSHPQQSASEAHISATIDKVARQTGGKVKQVYSVEEIENEKVRKDIEDGKEVTGWYDEKTGEVHLYMPNIHDSYTAEKTVWHETVGHKGMRGLLGDKFRTYLRSLWMDMDNPVFEELHKYVKERMAREPMSMYDAIEEFIAEAAEKGRGEAGFWNNIRNKVADALRSVGYRFCPNVKDVKYMLWLAKNVQIGAMANYSVVRGGQNKLKQAFALFVRNKGGQGLVTETKAWVEKVGTDMNGNDIWQEVYPDIQEGDTADEIANKVEAFEQDMKQKEAQGLAMNLTDRGDVGFKFERRTDKSQHFVDVAIAGKTHRFVMSSTLAFVSMKFKSSPLSLHIR